MGLYYISIITSPGIKHGAPVGYLELAMEVFVGKSWNSSWGRFPASHVIDFPEGKQQKPLALGWKS